MEIREIRLIIKDLLNENKSATVDVVKMNNKLIEYYTKKIGEVTMKVYAKYWF